MNENAPNIQEINPEWEAIAEEYQQKRNSIPQGKLIPFMLGLTTFEKSMREKYPEVDPRKVRLFHTLIGSTLMPEMTLDALDFPDSEVQKHIDAQLQ
jgi:hypothetical protein